MAVMDREKIKQIIPHREPFLLVDEVTEIKQGENIVVNWTVPEEMDVFRGHFPQAPVLPGVLTVEAMAQAADILLLSDSKYAGKIPYFIGIDKVKFKNKILPGETVRTEVRIINEVIEKSIVTCEATVYNQDTVAAIGQVSLAMR